MKFSNFDTREVDRRYYMLLDDFIFFDDVCGPVKALKGFHTNYASLDSLRNFILFPVYALLADYGDKSATIHDFLYNRGGYHTLDDQFVRVSRREADQIFYRALRAEGIARWRAGMFYAGVRIGGKKAYRGALNVSSSDLPD